MAVNPKRIHCTASINWKPTPRFKNKSNLNFKPKGTWYGIDTSWLDWVIDAVPSWIIKNYPVAYELQVDAKHLLIVKPEDVRPFIRHYKNKLSSYDEILWDKIKKDYKGIEFSPYDYENKCMLARWYSSLDCESGCIWDVSAITNTKRLPKKFTQKYINLAKRRKYE